MNHQPDLAPINISARHSAREVEEGEDFNSAENSSERARGERRPIRLERGGGGLELEGGRAGCN